MRYLKNNSAFTLIELLFVIVIMGIIGIFGAEFLAQAYKNFMYTKINNELQAKSAYAVEFISKRLQYRIKQSIIQRNLTLGNSDVNFNTLDAGSDENATVLEWIANDIEGFRGDGNSTWSGVLDLNETNTTHIVSLQTDKTKIDTYIKALSENNSTVNDTAIYFVGPTDTITNKWGWDGNVTEFNNQAGVEIHPINETSVANKFISPTGTFSGVLAYEYYKLSWTAYAVSLEHNSTTNVDDLYLYYNYQPWKGEQYDDTGKGILKQLIMNNVSSFQFRDAGSLLKIQVCTKSTLLQDQEYSLCKEKTVY